MSGSKPRLAIVSSHNICCALAYYADAVKDLLQVTFDVEILDLKTSELLRQDGENYRQASEAHIDQLCERLKEFDAVNIHLELGIFGRTTEVITSRIIRLCRASTRLILTVHTIDYKGGSTGHDHVYSQIMQELKDRPSFKPVHYIVHLSQEKVLLEKMYGVIHVSDFPLIFLTNERRQHFITKRNLTLWKQQFGLQDGDITLGIFGLLSAHKDHMHALRTLQLLPENYKLLIIGEAHHMNIREWQVDPVIQEMLNYLDNHPELADRVIFTGKREDAKYYEDLAHVDFVIIPALEVGQSGSASLSTALELSCAILKSNNMNCRGYQTYFPDCFEVFEIGNHHETKHKIIHFDKNKVERLKEKNKEFSETQLQALYLKMYESMQAVSSPMERSLN